MFPSARAPLERTHASSGYGWVPVADGGIVDGREVGGAGAGGAGIFSRRGAIGATSIGWAEEEYLAQNALRVPHRLAMSRADILLVDGAPRRGARETQPGGAVWLKITGIS